MGDINSLLPRYYKVKGTNPLYTPLREVVIDGHMVAWMKFFGNVIYDITGRGREGERFEGYHLYCECDFLEGVGWEIDEKGRVVSLWREGPCRYLVTAIYLRCLELRQEYADRFGLGEDPLDFIPPQEVLFNIISDLADKARTGEFVDGASFDGGDFYAETLAEIIDVPLELLWDILYSLEQEKIIKLDISLVKVL